MVGAQTTVPAPLPGCLGHGPGKPAASPRRLGLPPATVPCSSGTEAFVVVAAFHSRGCGRFPRVAASDGIAGSRPATLACGPRSAARLGRAGSVHRRRRGTEKTPMEIREEPISGTSSVARLRPRATGDPHGNQHVVGDGRARASAATASSTTRLSPSCGRLGRQRKNTSQQRHVERKPSNRVNRSSAWTPQRTPNELRSGGGSDGVLRSTSPARS